jgi:hypothetical protein
MNHTQIGRIFAMPILEWPSIFFAIFGAANCNKSQRRPNWESSVRVPQILNKWIRIISATSCQSPQTQNHPQTDSTMYDVWSPRYVWEAFGRFHSSLVLRTCWACGSRVWFPNKDSQSIASKVLPNLGIQSTESLGKKWHETKGPHPLQPVQPFFLSDEQRSPAVAIKQHTACSATAGFGFSHASGAPHSRGMIVMVIKSHPPDLSIYVDIHTFTCFKPSRLSTLG